MRAARVSETLVIVLIAWACAACVGSGERGSMGLPNAGYLRGGSALPLRGEGFVLARPTDPTRFGNDTLLRALERAFASVQVRFPGTPPMRVGDLGYRAGGKHSRHGSHRSGRDADVIFHATDAAGVPVPGSGFLAYDRYGIARAPSSPDAPAGLDQPIVFDVARNWHFVRTLLMDDAALTQWIFCSRGVKALLLEHAAQHEADPEVLMRAATVLHQPSEGRPHDDHFHIRVLCTAAERTQGCAEYGPVWPWLRDHVERVGTGDPEELDDRTLVRLLLEDLEPLPVVVAGASAPVAGQPIALR
jgi:penicillin-insensitive murein DD-endopeptidase